MQKDEALKLVKEYAEIFLIAIVLALIIRTFIVQAFKIPSGSMIPTLQIGDHILVNKFIFKFKKPNRKEIVVFKYPLDKKRDFIKRVIGLPGETIELKDRVVYINNEPINEPYAMYSSSSIDSSNFTPITVPDNSYFMMGDNRDSSMDSRYWGVLEDKLLIGKAFIIYWSWNREAKNLLGHVRWNRFFKLLH
ncbi:MAG: signal peptidase I [bacterium]